MKIYGITDIGLGRSMNQDTYETAAFSDSLLLACVCDGMGGPGGGEIASAIASKLFVSRLSELFISGTTLSELPDKMEDILVEINSEISAKASVSDAHFGMGTTLVSAVVSDKKALIVNVGDSRAYHISENAIRQVTKDHSMVQQLLDDGKITKEEFKNHPKKNIITKALGAFELVMPDYFEVALREDSKIVLCTDGLTNYVDDNEILFELTNTDDTDDALHQLVKIAYGRGAADNITVVVISN